MGSLSLNALNALKCLLLAGALAAAKMTRGPAARSAGGG
uniref:Secreted protein n=1 Tax=Sorangium cellulosum TaxID=56 RepID=A0A3S5GYF1_SORCE|nr:hypothetical protein [Sorangium cellulosum]